MKHTRLEAVHTHTHTPTGIFNKVNEELSVIKNYTVSLWENLNKEIDLL